MIPDNPQYYLDVESVGLISSIGLNDVPILQDRAGSRLRSVRPVNQWIRPGDNTLHVFGSWPKGVEFKPGKALLSASVFIARPDGEGIPEPLITLAKLAWPLEPAPEVYPMRLSIPFKVQLAPPLKLWTEAQKVESIEKSDHSTMVRIASELAAAIAGSRADAAFDLVKYRYDEEDRAYGKPQDHYRKTVVDQYDWIASHPNLKVQPLTTDGSTVRLFGQGTIALLERDPSAEAVILTSDATRFRIGCYFSKIAGAWKIVR